MNDEGGYMFPGFRGKWIPDTPAQRKTVVDRLRSWNAFSNSSPIEGIVEAIRTYSAKDKKISLYVFGDEFTDSSKTKSTDKPKLPPAAKGFTEVKPLPQILPKRPPE